MSDPNSRIHNFDSEGKYPRVEFLKKYFPDD